MSAYKYLCIFSRQMETIVYITLIHKQIHDQTVIFVMQKSKNRVEIFVQTCRFNTVMSVEL